MDVDHLPFLFLRELETPAITGEFVVRLRSCINTKEELFEEFAESANFPGYFGHNWDALFDCLLDFSWENSHVVVIVHEDLPLKNNPDELGIYLKILRDAVEDWKKPKQGLIVEPPEWMPYVEHELRVVFSNSVEKTVARILSQRTDEGDTI